MNELASAPASLAPTVARGPAPLASMVGAWRERARDDPAIAVPGRGAIGFAALARQVEHVAAALAERGVRPGDRVAVALPHGPVCAVALLGVATRTVAVPLDSMSRGPELRRLLEAAKARAMLVAPGASEAATAANDLGIDILCVEESADGLDSPLRVTGRIGPGTWPAPDREASDLAFLLATSGSTGGPKLVPRGHASVGLILDRFRAWHRLVPEDRSAVVTPLFHNSGLHTAFLAPLAAGCAIVMPKAPMPDRMASLVFDHGATFCSVSPMGLRALLAEARRRGGRLRHALRFVRTSAAAAPADLQIEAERILGVPVLQAWGMTEVGSHALSNPLPPGVRRHGTVGTAVSIDTEVAIMAPDGALLGAGETGELVVRGATVMSGYDGDADLGRARFRDGWFRTGDQAVRDAEGYVTILGRQGDAINRGGEKITPAEIDAALMEHAAVAEAACFPIPHHTLGEDVAGVVVLRPDATATDEDLRAHLAARLAAPKIPKRLVFRDTVPRGPTGKVRRRELARALGLDAEPAEPSRPDAAAGSSVASDLARLWTATLGRTSVAPDEDFFALGGDSLQATQLILDVERLYGCTLRAEDIFGPAHTVRGMARVVEAAKGTRFGPSALAGPVESRDIDFVEFGGPDRAGAKRSLFHVDPATNLRRPRAGARSGAIAINALGFRGPDVSHEKLKGQALIAFLGSSDTFDSMVSGNDRTWPHLTWLGLSRAFPDRDIDYVNAGVPGYWTRHMALTFEHYVVPLVPDVVVIRANDLNRDSAVAARAAGIHDGVHYRTGWLARRSRPLAKLEKNAVIAARLASSLRGRGKLRVDGRDLARGFERRLESLVRACHARGASVAVIGGGGRLRPEQPRWRQMLAARSHVIYMPYMRLDALVAAREAYRKAAAEVAARTGALWIDGNRAVPGEAAYFVDSNHFSDAGSARMAAHVADALANDPDIRTRLTS